MVTSVSYEIDQKRKLVRTLGFFLDFSSQLILTTGSWDSLPVCLVTSGDHGDHGTSVSVGQWAYSDVSLNLTLCQWLTFWREICVISLRKVSWWVVVVGGIAIIESAPGPDLEIWDGDGYEMTWTWPGHDLDMTWTWPGHDLDMVWTRAWQLLNWILFRGLQLWYVSKYYPQFRIVLIRVSEVIGRNRITRTKN